MIYCGVLDDLGGQGHAANVVLHVMQGKLNCGHAIYKDNFNHSVGLDSKLILKGTIAQAHYVPIESTIMTFVETAKIKRVKL